MSPYSDKAKAASWYDSTTLVEKVGAVPWHASGNVASGAVASRV
jgi:hypothetical protein